MDLYPLQPNDHYEIYTGILDDEIQFIAADYYRKPKSTFVIVMFDVGGNFFQVIEKSHEEFEAVYTLDIIDEIFKGHEVCIVTIEIEPFHLKDYDIGVLPFPEEYENFLSHLAVYSGQEHANYQDELFQWMESEDFVFLWNNDFWCDKYSEIIAS